MDKNWVLIRKGNLISKIPYQAFKDVFEKDGFELVNDDDLGDSPILSLSADNKGQNEAQATGGVKRKAGASANVNKDAEKKENKDLKGDSNNEPTNATKPTSRRGKK